VRVLKRDGSLQTLEIAKVQRAMLMAFQSVAERPDVMPLVHRVMAQLVGRNEPYSVEMLADLIEEELVNAGHTHVARRYMRYRIKRAAARARRLVPDPRAISEYIHVAKYGRYQATLGRRELHHETVDRSRSMHIKRWPHLEEEIYTAFKPVYKREGMPSMRSMQFGGAAIEKNNERIYNCAGLHISRWRAFQETFYLLLCGCGVGYSVQWQHVEQLTELGHITRNVQHHTIADTIEGWATALGVLITSYVRSLGYVEFNYSKIRGEGEPLITSGGKAPGHLDLKKCLEAVRAILDRAAGRKLRPIECHDILCHAALAVLSGGIRRSSLLSLFSVEDTEMMYAKARGNFRYASGADPGHNAQREMANNSAALLRNSVTQKTFSRIIRVAQENGDPGFYFTANLDYIPNPCGEIGMWPMHREAVTLESGVSFCNLTEVNCAVMRDEEHLLATIRAMAAIGTFQAAYTCFNYLEPVSEAIVKREALLGVGLTGIMDNKELMLDAGVLQRAARAAVEENARVSLLIGIRRAARVTTVKPSGTASLALGGVSSGIHPRWSRRYIQRITANPIEPIAQHFKKMNPHMVEIAPNGDLKIMFPIQAADGAVTVKEQSAQEFMDAVFLVYKNWILPGVARGDSAPGLTHNVSCTVIVREGELDAVIERVWSQRDNIAAMTFAPYLIDQKFRYAPRQAIRDEGLWNKLIELYKPIDWSKFREETDTTCLTSEPACSGGTCEIL